MNEPNPNLKRFSNCGFNLCLVGAGQNHFSCELPLIDNDGNAKKLKVSQAETTAFSLCCFDAVDVDEFWEFAIIGAERGAKFRVVKESAGTEFDHFDVDMRVNVKVGPSPFGANDLVEVESVKLMVRVKRQTSPSAAVEEEISDRRRGPCCVTACNMTVCDSPFVCIICDGFEHCCMDPPEPDPPPVPDPPPMPDP